MDDLRAFDRREAPACVVYHGANTEPDSFDMSRESVAEEADESRSGGGRDPSSAESRTKTRWRPADNFFAKDSVEDEAAVLIVDASMLDRIGDARRFPRHLVLVAADEASETALGGRAHTSLVGLNGAAARKRALRTACELSDARLTIMRQRRQLVRTRQELHELNRIGMGLMLERDEGVLLHQILGQAKRFTESDAGCLLLLETDERNVRRVCLALCETDSVPDLRALTAKSIPVDDSSTIGHAALIGEPVIIDDLYDLPPDAGFARDPDFDRQFDYRIRSMLIVPMIDHRDRLVGVLVLINRKSNPTARITSKLAADQYVLSYTDRELHLARSLAGQAAVSIENARLYALIERTLSSFVKSAVTAIDQRDPTTAGHSLRVAALTTDLAEAVEREGRSPYRNVRFTRDQMRELYFAALLHDFGKIAVRENVLMKAKKLPPALWERVDARFALIRRTIEVQYLRTHASRSTSTSEVNPDVARLDDEFAEHLEEIERFHNVVRTANEPGGLPEIGAAELLDIARRTFEQPDRSLAPYLTAEELHYLELSDGTLDDHERVEVESHVEATYHYLIGIPWTDNLKNLATYAYEHHEKLDGTGYPRKLKGDEIPIQARILAIADIFDAMTTSDRPYRRAVPSAKALEIIQSEASTGRLDSELVRIMVESQVYRRVLEEDWRQF